MWRAGAVRALLLCLLAGVVAAGRDTTATPVDKVITLLSKLSQQVQKEGIEEAASYDKYACFCKDQADAKVYALAKSDKKIAELDAAITALEGEIAELDGDVKTAKESKGKEEDANKDAKKIREGENDDYKKDQKSLQDAVKAVEGALASLENAKGDVDSVSAAGALIQRLKSTPALALIAGATAGARYSGPGEAHSYQYKSKEVIATLTSLLMTFKKELADLDKAEITTVSEFEMAYGARLNTITALEKEITEKETLSASKGEEKASKTEDKDEETAARKADQAFLDDLTAKCNDKAQAWDQRSTTRAAELTALTKAVELLKGMGDLYSTNSKLVGLVAKTSHTAPAKVHQPPSFVQIVRHTSRAAQLEQLATSLRTRAATLGSASLALLAVRLESLGPDHFVKVRGLIKDLITKLEEDAAAEATQKTACDKNMKAAVEKRDEQAAAIELATGNIDSTEAEIEKMKNDIATLSADIAQLNKDLVMAQELRSEEKAANEKTIENADTGKEAVDKAIEVLSKFYEGFLQFTPKDSDRSGKTVGDLAPETFSSDEEYKGKADASKGIIGMLEVISSDFARTSSTTTDAEKQSDSDFKELESDTKEAIKDKEKQKETVEGDVESKKSDLTGFKNDLKTAKKMNEEALEELEKLQASCVDTGESWAERAKHRKEEIEALKQALTILEEWKD